ncbi:MAG: helix-turn-helix transcriptional regulator, partial [Sphingobacteriia bacterium]|nr:helix-turn-helix transcriptional regulator [Sphingobacteriia bacterium]
QNCPGYISWVLSRAPGMTQGELRTACMIRLGLTSREIARAQNIGVYGVAQSRYRLRKRLGLSTRVSIEEVLQPRGMG